MSKRARGLTGSSVGTGDDTDATGFYSIDLPAGDVTVQFSGGPLHPQFATEYYNDVLDPEDQTHFDLSSDGDTQSNVDAELGLAGNITGTVRDSSGTPVQDVCMDATFLDGDESKQLQTDPSGNYSFTTLAPGHWLVHATAGFGCSTANLRSEFFSGAHSINTATPVIVPAGGTAANTNFALAPGVAVSGTVTEVGTGVPIGDVQVQLIDAVTGARPFASNSTTALDGTYAITGLEPGTYLAKFTDVNTAGLHATEYYDDSATFAGATTITLGAGAIRSDVNAVLAPEGTITGTVTDTVANGLDDICIYAYDHFPAGDDDEQSAFGSTDANGDYSLGRLPTGNYHLYFEPCSNQNYASEWFNNHATYAGSDTVSVTAGSASTADIELGAGGVIGGTLTDVNGPIEDECVEVVSSEGLPLGSTQTGVAGNYAISTLPAGNVTVHFGGCTNHVSEYYNDKPTAATATPVTSTPGDPPQILNANLAISGEIAGKVTRIDGTPMPGICVAVYDADTDQQIELNDQAVATRNNGRYVVFGLGAGDYKVGFSGCMPGDGVYADEYFNDKATLTDADLVGVTTAQRTGGVNAVLALKSDATEPPPGDDNPPPPPDAKDTKAPTVKIDKGPARHSKNRSPKVRFSADEANVTFFCSLDGRDPAACESPKKLRRLDRGRHRFVVYAVDAAGNQGAAVKAKFKIERSRPRHHHHGN